MLDKMPLLSYSPLYPSKLLISQNSIRPLSGEAQSSSLIPNEPIRLPLGWNVDVRRLLDKTKEEEISSSIYIAVTR